MRLLGVGAAALAGSACISIPPFVSTPLPATDGVAVAADGGGARVTGPSFSLRFGATGFHFPDSLQVTGTETLASAPSCNVEDGFGISVFPGFVASAQSTSTVGAAADNAITRPRLGPAVAQVAVAWSGQYSCTGSHVAHGTSTYTAFPDGRIVRHDAFVASDDLVPNPSQCACDSTFANFYVTSFFTFAAPAFSALRSDALPAFPSPLSTETGDTVGAKACIDGAGPRIALAWRDSMTRIREPFPGAFALVYDFTTLNGSASLDATPRDTTMALLVDDGKHACDALTGRLTAFPQLLVDGREVPNDADGIYVDPMAHDGEVRISSPSLVPAGAAITLDFGAATDVAIAARSALLYQRDPDGRFTIWFRDELTANDAVTVTPR